LAPDPAAGHVRMRLGGDAHVGGGAHVGGSDIWQRAAAGSPALAELRLPTTIFAGKRLRVAKGMAKLTGCFHGKFKRLPRHGAQGGRRPKVGERRRHARLGRNEEGMGKGFLSTCGSFGGRESGREGSDGEDRHRRPKFEDGGGELGWRH
jgi:hypothetical protein